MKRAGIALALLAAAVALPSLANGFVYDDVAIIRDNPLVHRLGSTALWQASYWPVGGLYRPLTLQLFAVEWAVGGGRPVVFHAVSTLLAALTTLLVYRLARRGLPDPAAAAAAGLFAVHPVHVEAVAGVVGQGELLAACFTLLAVERYLAWREAGAVTPRGRAALAGLTLLAIGSKETGYVVPLLLAAAELTRFRAPRRGVAGVFALQGGAVVAALLIRLIVLGTLSGETPAAAFSGLAPGPRAIGMLQVVPEWTRLLFWPAHLQAEYGPPALALDRPFGAPHLLGAALLLAGMALCWWSRRRQPVAAFGLLWIAIALAPVSNLLAPTGIVLAERTLFLPSVGLALTIGAALAPWLVGSGGAARRPSRLVAVPLVILLALGATGSVLRQPVWRSDAGFFDRLVRDAPRSYRAHLMASKFHHGAGHNPEAERAARQALALYRGDPRVHEQLGQILRVEGRCAEALPVLLDGVTRFPDATTARSRLIECALAVGDTVRARRVAEDAVALGQREFQGTVKRLTASAPVPPPSR